VGPSGRIEIVRRLPAAEAAVKQRFFEFVFLEPGCLAKPGTDIEEEWLRDILEPFLPPVATQAVVIMIFPRHIPQAVQAMKEGVFGYLTLPLVQEEVAHLLGNLRETRVRQWELEYLRDRFWQSDSLELIRSHCDCMREVYRKIQAVAPTRSTVLLSGETGTGKGVIARLIHRHSNRAGKPFISVHCGSIPDTLLESELFGHEKGSFTGAIRRKLGRFEIAQGGTIFLDEIGTVSSAMQIKLLQILQDRTFQRVGGESVHTADVRIIAATNENLKEKCEKGLFRDDLYYRLNVFPIEIPPLRERREDIGLLVEGFLKKLGKYQEKEIHGVHPRVLDALKAYDWPGNIRELENLVERAYILESSPVLSPDSFPGELFGTVAAQPLMADVTRPLAEARRMAVMSFETEYLRRLLEIHGGRIAATAAAAGISERQLHKLMSRAGLRKEDFKQMSPHRNSSSPSRE
jgi:DNA-binding NtrC family response regulator